MRFSIWTICAATAATIVTGLCTAQADSTTVALIPSADNTLYENPSSPLLSNGAGVSIFAGNTLQGLSRRALLKFDVAGALPAGAVIESARLRVVVTLTIAGEHTHTLHRVTKRWGEGTSIAPANTGGAGAPVTPDSATWDFASWDTSLWTTPGGDFVASPSASTVIEAFAPFFFESTPELVADVQSFLDEPANNFGWIIIGDELANTTAKRFGSRENPDATLRPELTIRYSAPACTGDVDGNLIVDDADLGLLLSEFGCPLGCSADLDGDGDVDDADLGLLLSNFGARC